MYDNKNLSKEFKATVEETKGLLMALWSRPYPLWMLTTS